jgi:hypothetical protein
LWCSNTFLCNCPALPCGLVQFVSSVASFELLIRVRGNEEKLRQSGRVLQEATPREALQPCGFLQGQRERALRNVQVSSAQLGVYNWECSIGSAQLGVLKFSIGSAELGMLKCSIRSAQMLNWECSSAQLGVLNWECSSAQLGMRECSSASIGSVQLGVLNWEWGDAGPV